MPSHSFYVPDNWQFAEVFEKRWKAHPSKRLGTYVYELLDRAMAAPDGGLAGVTPANAIVELAKTFRIDAVEQLEKICAERKINQAAILSALLAALPDWLEKRYDPSQPYLVLTIGQARVVYAEAGGAAVVTGANWAVETTKAALSDRKARQSSSK